MPNITADEILTFKHKRAFIQFGSARPNNPVRYAGQQAQYLAINGLSLPESGGIDPIWVGDPRRVGFYRLVGKSVSPPDLPTVDVVMREAHGAIPRQLTKLGCALNLYEVSGICNDLSDPLLGWSDYVMIYSGGVVTDKDAGDRTSFDSDDPIEDTLSLTLSAAYPIGGIAFGEKAAALVDREVIDVVWGGVESCGNCGPQDDGTLRIYAVTKTSGAGSPGLPTEVVYSLDGGTSWNQVVVTGMGASEDAVAIEIMGRYLVVVGQGAYYYAELNTKTGVPGTFTKVSTGFVSGKNPTDMWVAGSREAYFSALGGYIYKCEDITAGVVAVSQADVVAVDLNRVHGTPEIVVAVGQSGAIIKSVNHGITWSASPTSPVTLSTFQAICVLDTNRFWVGTTGQGRVYYTLNGGETWTEQAFAGSGSGTVWDIVFATDEVGFISHATTTPTGRLFATYDGGYNWIGTNVTNPRLIGWPTMSRAGRVAVPNVSDPAVASNALAVAGLSGGGTDGILVVGLAGKI